MGERSDRTGRGMTALCVALIVWLGAQLGVMMATYGLWQTVSLCLLILGGLGLYVWDIWVPTLFPFAGKRLFDRKLPDASAESTQPAKDGSSS